jgi:hypothetical protein
MKANAWFVAFALALSGCVNTTGSAPPGSKTEAASSRSVSTARAIQLFDAICGGSLANDFASAKALMAKNGVTVRSPVGTATVYSETENVSFQIQDGPGFGNTCSMVWGTSEARSTVVTAVSKIGPFKSTPLGTATVYRGQRYLVLFGGGSQKTGPVAYYNLKLLSDH